MLTFTQNSSRGQLYAECSETGADYRIPTNKVEDFLAEIRLTREELLANSQWKNLTIKEALEKYNG